MSNARDVFPELVGIDGRRITFSVSVRMNNSEKAQAVIGPMVWGSLVQRLRMYEVINIEIEQALGAEKGLGIGARLRSFMFPARPGSSQYHATDTRCSEGHTLNGEMDEKMKYQMSKV